MAKKRKGGKRGAWSWTAVTHTVSIAAEDIPALVADLRRRGWHELADMTERSAK